VTLKTDAWRVACALAADIGPGALPRGRPRRALVAVGGRDAVTLKL